PPPPVLTQVLEWGKFQKVGDSLTVQAGNTLELRCKGKPVEWAFPDYVEEEDEGRLRVIQHLKYSSLVLVNSTGADTGEYICYPMYCEDSDCRREYDRAAKTFIFFSDPVAPPSPTISASLRSVHAGQNLQVTCTVLGELEVVIDFTWEYPGQKATVVLHVKYFGASATSSAFQNDLDRFKAASLHVSVFLLVDRQAALHPGQHLDVALGGADAAAVRDSSHGGRGEGRGPGHPHLHCQQPGRLHQRVHHRHGAAGTDSQVQTPLTTAFWGAL
ncbi:UNVERIFIED_CONTAM: hypothetical protein FKN15_055756, partial [Acipenser sinensis]